jgi:hypothetical protein
MRARCSNPGHPATSSESGCKSQLPDALRPWLRPILETVLPGLRNQKTMAAPASIDHTGLKNHKKLRVRKL